MLSLHENILQQLDKRQNSLPLINVYANKKNKQSSKTVHVSNQKSLIIKNPIQNKKAKKTTLISLSRSVPKYTSFFNKKSKTNNLMSFNNLQMIDQLFHSQCDVPINVPVTFFKKSAMNMSTKSIKEYVIVSCKQSRRANRQNIIQSQYLQKKSLAKKQIQSILQVFRNKQTKQIKNIEEIYKAIKAFKKAERHLALKFNFSKILFHHLAYEVCYEFSKIQDAIRNLCFCQYYARKNQVNSYIIPCLIVQSELWFGMYEFEQTLKCLKTALEFSVVLRNKQAQLRILQKVGIIYYYIGNSYMARYYNNLSEKGLQPSQFQVYRKQYSKKDQLQALQHKIFHFPLQKTNKRKHNERYELDLSRDLIQDHQKYQMEQKQLIISMLKSQKQSKNGIFIKRIMEKNNQHSKINFKGKKLSKKFSSNNFQPPLQNCTQVIKAHLSKNRVFKFNDKTTDFSKTLWFLQKYKSQLDVIDYSSALNTGQGLNQVNSNLLKVNHIR